MKQPRPTSLKRLGDHLSPQRTDDFVQNSFANYCIDDVSPWKVAVGNKKGTFNFINYFKHIKDIE